MVAWKQKDTFSLDHVDVGEFQFTFINLARLIENWPNAYQKLTREGVWQKTFRAVLWLLSNLNHFRYFPVFSCSLKACKYLYLVVNELWSLILH